MRNKKTLIMIILLIGISALVFTACSKEEATKVEEKVTAVETVKAKVESKDVTKDYIGTVESKNLIKYSFKTAGKIDEIFVKEGQSIKEGDKLATLDLEDLNYKLQAAQAQMNAANKDIKKTNDDYTYKQDLYNKMKLLYEEGSISKDTYDKTKLAKDVSESTHNQAQSQYALANTNYNQVSSLMDDAVIYATKDGSVVSTQYESHEMVPAGYPVVIIRSESQIVNIGVVQKDLNDITIGTKAYVNVDGVEAHGEVITIAEAPDKMTRTYNAEVLVEDQKYRIGSIAKIKMENGNKEGIWLPINMIMSDGVDYVYIVKDGRAFKRVITLNELNGEYILIENVEAGEEIIKSGMKNISDGSKVNVVK